MDRLQTSTLTIWVFHNMSHIIEALLTNESFYTYTHILKNWGYYRLLPQSAVGVNLDRSDVLSKYKASASLIGLIAGDTNIIIILKKNLNMNAMIYHGSCLFSSCTVSPDCVHN